MKRWEVLYPKKEVSYDEMYNSLEGWLAYAKHANTWKKRQEILESFQKK